MASRAKNAKSDGALDPALPQKKRARRRLVGAAAVCLAAAIVLPIVLDSEPRQIRDDVQVQIPSRDTPLAERTTRDGVIDSSGATESAAPARTEAGAGAQSTAKPEPPSTPDSIAKPGSDAKPDSIAKPGSDAKPDPVAKPRSDAKPEAVAKPRSDAKPEAVAKQRSDATPEPAARPELAARPEPAAKNAFAVQIGAFSSPKGASDQLERARKLRVQRLHREDRHLAGRAHAGAGRTVSGPRECGGRAREAARGRTRVHAGESREVKRR